jgi:hypothetical protein
MKHWPWQHRWKPIAAERTITCYTGDHEGLEKGIGCHETIVLLRCECTKVKTRRLQGHWTKEQLDEAFK